MNTAFVTMVVIALLLLVPLALLFIGGQLIRASMARKASGLDTATPSSRFARDLQGLEDALIEFFACSKASSGIFTVLAAHREPVGFHALVEEVRTEQGQRPDSEDLPTSALRAVLAILQVVRLVLMSWDGFSITELGREVCIDG